MGWNWVSQGSYYQVCVMPHSLDSSTACRNRKAHLARLGKRFCLLFQNNRIDPGSCTALWVIPASFSSSIESRRSQASASVWTGGGSDIADWERVSDLISKASNPQFASASSKHNTFRFFLGGSLFGTIWERSTSEQNRQQCQNREMSALTM